MFFFKIIYFEKTYIEQSCDLVYIRVCAQYSLIIMEVYMRKIKKETEMDAFSLFYDFMEKLKEKEMKSEESHCDECDYTEECQLAAPSSKKGKLFKEVLEEQNIPAGTRAQFRKVTISSPDKGGEKDVKVDIPVKDTAGNNFEAIALERHELEMIKFAANYIKKAKAGESLEEYRSFFKDNVLPMPNFKQVISYMRG